MEILEDVIRSSIFIQITTFPLKIAIISFHMEAVSNDPVKIFLIGVTLQTFLSFFLWKCFHDGRLTELLFFINGLLFFTAEPYVICYYLTEITLNGCMIGEIVYNAHWYEFTTADQWIVQRIIHRAQEPFVFKGFGIIYYSLNTFAKVAYYFSPFEFLF